MTEFGLTGGIGSGKSSVSQRLVARGAGLVDADATVKRLQQPGMAVFEAMVEHFGQGIVGDDGQLDRPAIAAIVFHDEDQLKALNDLVHPAVRTSMKEQRDSLAESHEVVILDIPLLVEGSSTYADLAGVIVVDLPVAAAVTRLVEHRGFTEADASARIASQVDRDERLKVADFVVDNSGSLADLDAEVDRCWSWIQGRLAERNQNDGE
ncbi:MAG: dephospho-CoA kinase [Actinomycetota bacterium]